METKLESPAEEISYLRPKRVAKMADVSQGTVYSALYSGDLKGRLFKGRIWLIRHEDVVAWIEKNSEPNVRAA